MSQLNRKNIAKQIKPKQAPEQQLRRLVLASLLWEQQFYIDGETHANLVKSLVKLCDPEVVAQLALEARTKFKLRHIPLLLTRELARNGKLKAETLTAVIQRADEISEFLAVYWQDGKQPLSNQVKKGLAACFLKFSDYELAKWDKGSSKIGLRDAMFLSRPKPQTLQQAATFSRLAQNCLPTPLTWETELSAGADKCETFTRLMQENKLGALAFLRNLRNMLQSGVDHGLIEAYSQTVDVSRVLPFRFLGAAKRVPQLKPMLEGMMFRALGQASKLPGRTVLLIDVSGSMFGTKLSQKSSLDRFEAAAALAILCREICESVAVYSFSDDAVQVESTRGFALEDAILNSQEHGGTQLGKALATVHQETTYDRVIVFTDEQSYDEPPDPRGLGYIINVAAYENGISNKAWTTISGFSEAVIEYIQAAESENI
jgi:60 kDa SS-A/Ro ribonucleoprotein